MRVGDGHHDAISFEGNDGAPPQACQTTECPERIMIFLFSSLAVLFVAMTLSAIFHLRWARRLPAWRDLPAVPDEEQVRCSVVLAARNEEARIGDTIRHLLRQTGVQVEVIVVDDSEG